MVSELVRLPSSISLSPEWLRISCWNLVGSHSWLTQIRETWPRWSCLNLSSSQSCKFFWIFFVLIQRFENLTNRVHYCFVYFPVDCFVNYRYWKALTDWNIPSMCLHVSAVEENWVVHSLILIGWYCWVHQHQRLSLIQFSWCFGIHFHMILDDFWNFVFWFLFHSKGKKTILVVCLCFGLKMTFDLF